MKFLRRNKPRPIEGIVPPPVPSEDDTLASKEAEAFEGKEPDSDMADVADHVWTIEELIGLLDSN